MADSFAFLYILSSNYWEDGVGFFHGYSPSLAIPVALAKIEHGLSIPLGGPGSQLLGIWYGHPIPCHRQEYRHGIAVSPRCGLCIPLGSRLHVLFHAVAIPIHCPKAVLCAVEPLLRSLAKPLGAFSRVLLPPFPVHIAQGQVELGFGIPALRFGYTRSWE